MTVTDIDLDAANGTLSIKIVDDVPTGGTTTATTLDEEGLTGGIDGGSGDLAGANLLSTTGTLTGYVGADGPNASGAFSSPRSMARPPRSVRRR